MSENFESLVEAARGGDEQAFRGLVEPLARELHAYAYRMLGGFHDADDVLQESRLKAWRGLAAYEPRASFRAWMYRIVTNTCLDLLKARSRRVLPQEVCAPVAPGPPTTSPRTDILWLEPYPDALLPAASSPERALRLREGIRLAFVRAVQVLPPRQRAALILHDVLDWSVVEVAAILETTEAAINSALQRARAAIARPREEPPALAPRHAEIVDRFVHAWESGDFDGFVQLLATDAVMNMPPWEYWLDGKDAVVSTMTAAGTWDGEPRPGRYRIVPAPMNGEPGGLAYVRGPDGRYHAVCLTVLSLDAEGRIDELTTFVLPELFTAWGFPPALEEAGRPEYAPRPMPVTYARLRSGDGASLRALNEVYAVAFDDDASYRGKLPSDAYLEELLASRDFIALVARDGATIVGGLTAYVLRKQEQERSEIYLYDLAVLAAHRRRGIARNLIRELQRIGHERDAWVVFVQADRGDDPAIALYTSLGTREDVHHFDLPVEVLTSRT